MIAVSAGADEDPPDAMDVNPQAANEEASVPAPVAPASSSLPRRGSGPDLPGKAATGASRTPKGTRFADAGGEAGSAAARAKPASNPGKAFQNLIEHGDFHIFPSRIASLMRRIQLVEVPPVRPHAVMKPSDFALRAHKQSDTSDMSMP